MTSRHDGLSAECRTPLADESLLDYWLGALDGAAEDDLERHVFACGACADRLRATFALAGALRGLARSGALRLVVSEDFVQRAEADGLHVRRYAVAPGESIACTVSADDDLLISRFAADLAGASRVDLSLCDATGRERQRLADIPVRGDAVAVVYQESTVMAKGAPDDVMVARLLAVGDDGSERLLGEYTMRHTRTIPGPPSWGAS